MKKLICLLLTIAMVFTLCACGEPEIVEVEKEVIKEVVPEEYADLIDALKAEDYDGAVALIDAMRPIPEVPDPICVELTLDNFFDYFELTEYESITEKYADGRTKLKYMSVAYVLKEGFMPAEGEEYSSSVEIGYTGRMREFNAKDVDFENMTYTFVRSFGGRDASETVNGLTLIGNSVYGIALTDIWTIISDSSYDLNMHSATYEDLNLVRAEGCIWLIEQ